MERRKPGVEMIGTLKTGNLNVVLSKSLAQEYLTAKESVVVAKIVIRNGTGELEQANTTVQNRKLVIALGLIHSSMLHGLAIATLSAS